MKLHLLLLTALVFTANVNCANSIASHQIMKEKDIRLEVKKYIHHNLFMMPLPLGMDNFWKIDVIIENSTKDIISISPDSINYKLIDISKLKKNTPLMFFGSSSFIVPMLFLSYLDESTGLQTVYGSRANRFANPFSKENSWQYRWTQPLSGIGLAVLLISTLWDKYTDFKYKKLLLHNHTIVKPGESIKKTILIDKNSLNEKFDFKVFNEDGSQVIHTFNVNLT